MKSTNDTPLSESLSIVLAGRTNAGKSSLLNAPFQKDVAVVSAVEGTTCSSGLKSAGKSIFLS